MLMALNLLALVVMLVVAYMSWVQGVYRAALTLVACVIAGAVAFGFYGPVAGLVPGSDDLRAVWHYAADAVALWALFCVAFLALRTIGEKLLRHQPAFPHLVDGACGAVLGLGTGYLAAGMCLILAQMLPLAPDDIMGAYSPFKYERTGNSAVRGPDLWLAWDRGTLAFFNYLSARPLGSEDHSVFHRYGSARAGSGQASPSPSAPDMDDFFYYHWYRRWEYVWWSTGRSQGPIPEDYPVRIGMGLVTGREKVMSDVRVRIGDAETKRGISYFEQERLGGDEQFVLVNVAFGPAGPVPLTVDSDQFVLVWPKDGKNLKFDRYAKPMVYGPARQWEGQNQALSRSTTPPEMAARDLRFGIPDVKRDGRYLASGAAFTFKTANQEDSRTLIFVVPRDRRVSDLRLVVEPPPAPQK